MTTTPTGKDPIALRINGKEVPPEKQGRKVKLYTLMPMIDIEKMLLSGKEAGCKRAQGIKDECMAREVKVDA